MLFPYHWSRAIATGQRLRGYLSNRRAKKTLEVAGLRVERTIAIGFFGDRILAFMPFSLALRLERWLMTGWFLPRIAVNQIFVCRRRD